MECANCGRKYWNYSPRHDNWCPNERVFLCQKCLTRGRACPSCGSRASSLSAMLVMQGAMFLAIFLAVGLLTLPGTLANAHENSIPVTSVSALSPGTQEKVSGTVSPNQSVVILVFDYTDSSGQTVVGRHVESFWLNDSSGRVLILMGSNSSSTPTIANGGQPYPSSNDPSGFEYVSGDQISVLGNVGLQGNELVLTAIAVGPSPGALVHADLVFQEFFIGIPAAIASVVIAIGVFWTRSRLALHNRNLIAWKAKRPKALENAPPSDEIRWFENAYLRTLRRMAWALNLASLAVVVVFLIVVVSPIPFPDSTYFGVLVGTPIVLIFTGTFGVGQYFASRRGLRRIGLSSKGVYFDWSKPPKNSRPFVAWSDIRELEAPTAADRHTVKLDTPLGQEYVNYVDSELIRRLRIEFESARVPYRDQSAPIRPSVESLTGSGPPGIVADVTWSHNTLRPRWALYGILGLSAEIPLVPLLLLKFPELLSNQGVALFFLPGLFGAQFLYLSYRMVREIGTSNAGIHLKERTGERTILWSDIAEFTPAWRGFRYKTFSGFAEGVPLLDAPDVERLVDALNHARGVEAGTSTFLPPPESAWVRNSIRARAQLLFVLMFGVPVSLGILGAVLLIALPPNPNWVLLIGFACIPAVFSMYPAAWWRASPVRIAFTSDAVFVDSPGKSRPGRLRAMRYSTISSLKGEEPVGGTSVVPGMKSYLLTVKTKAGLVLDTGFVSPEVARAFAGRLKGDQLTEWKIRNVSSAGS